MAKYTKMEIHELCKRLEGRADSVVNAQPSFAGDMKAAAMLLRLMMALSEIESLETDHASTH